MRSFLAPANPKDRFEVYRFFNGMSDEAKAGLDRGRTRVPLVKTFLLEHVAQRGQRKPRLPEEIFSDMGAEVEKIDESFMSLAVREANPETKTIERRTVGFLERYDERFFAYYTCEESKTAKPRVSRWIQNPELDARWFSSPFLQGLWDGDVSNRGDDRFGKRVFKHESIFDMPEDFAEDLSVAEEEAEYEAEESVDEEEERPQVERRKARFEMGDRIGRIRQSLKRLQEDYDPLYVLYALRLPSQLGRGGHDLYQTGQITNRSDNFEDHRNTARNLYRIYKTVLELTEECAWQQVSKPNGDALSIRTRGVPLIVRFGEPLSKGTFDRWVSMAFQKRNRFKLWGNPIYLGPTKVHVYGADRHLWQPINLELTSSSVVAILPQGTCGNTFHRLIANIQHYVCPKIKAWIGAQPFESLVSQWPADGGKSNAD